MLKEISEEELEELAIENTPEKYYYTLDSKGVDGFQMGFKAGYRKALNRKYVLDFNRRSKRRSV